MERKFTPTYNKVILSVLISTSLALLLFYYLYDSTKKQEQKVYNASKEQFSSEVNSLMELKSEALVNLTHDLTFWDNYIDFIENASENLNWYKVNIESIGESYHVDYVATYDINANVIKENSFEKIKSHLIIPKELFSKIYDEKQLQFYQEIPEGIIEVHAATIHPTIDSEKTKTKPRGYFIVVKLLDEDYFINLKKISNSAIKILDPETLTTSNNANITAIIALKNYKGEIIKNIQFVRDFNLNFKHTKIILLIILSFFILNLIITILLSKNSIYHPLKLVTKILKTNDKQAIQELVKGSGEFGYIGTLFSENLEHEEKLIIAKEKAEESDRLKTEFLHNLSHEIRTPMNAIIGFSDLLSEPNLNETKKLEYLEVIKKCGKNLVSIIDDLIEMSKIDTNQMKPNYKAFDLEECLTEIKKSVEITIPIDKPIKLILTSPKTPLTLPFISDEVKLKQILVNLLNNAIKFTNEGVVSFGYEIDSNNKTILFKVKDTGIGIDEKGQKEVFNRFTRIHTDETITASGLGLGLAISKAYVKILNGDIWLESKKNIGSVFSFSIPLKTEELPNQSIISTNKPTFNKNKTILVAEDDSNSFILLEILLSEKGYNIIRANNGIEAVNFCANNKNIDLVLMDIRMPKISGLEAQKQIKNFNPSLPIIALSAYVSAELKKEVIKAGFKDYIPKPLVKEQLFDALNKIFYVKERPI